MKGLLFFCCSFFTVHAGSAASAERRNHQTQQELLMCREHVQLQRDVGRFFPLEDCEKVKREIMLEELRILAPEYIDTNKVRFMAMDSSALRLLKDEIKDTILARLKEAASDESLRDAT